MMIGTRRRRFLVSVFHEAPSDTLARELGRHEEVIDAPGGLDVGISRDDPVDLHDERVDALHAHCPGRGVCGCRGPGFELPGCVVARGRDVHRGEVHAVQGGFVTGAETAELHGVRSVGGCVPSCVLTCLKVRLIRGPVPGTSGWHGAMMDGRLGRSAKPQRDWTGAASEGAGTLRP